MAPRFRFRSRSDIRVDMEARRLLEPANLAGVPGLIEVLDGRSFERDLLLECRLLDTIQELLSISDQHQGISTEPIMLRREENILHRRGECIQAETDCSGRFDPWRR